MQGQKGKRASKQGKSKSGIADAKSKRKVYACPYEGCGKTFTESGNLRTHLRTHTGERPFVCEFEGCGKSFVTKGHLKSHYITHTGEKPNKCEVCGKRYSRIGRLRIHERIHTGEKPFVCPYESCGKAFAEKGNLNTHLRIHTGEKPYQCTFEGCGKKFTTLGHLRDHTRRHTNERPYVCDTCGAAFLRSNTLKIHYRRHTGERPYVCSHEGCGKAFAESGNLRTHMRIHDPVQPSKEDTKNQQQVVPQSPSPIHSILPSLPEEQKAPICHPLETKVMLPLAALRPPEESAPAQSVAPPSTQVSFSSTASSLMNAGFFASSPQARSPLLPYIGALATTPNVFSHNSPSAFSPKLGTATNDFGSMYLRATLGSTPRNFESQMSLSPHDFGAGEGFGSSPITSQFPGLCIPK